VSATERPPLVFDANVLIDFLNADDELLTAVVRTIGPVHVPVPVLNEVETLDEARCGALGLDVVMPTLREIDAASTPSGRLSFADRTCLTLSHQRGWTCVTNERALRNACKAAGVPVARGLRLLICLVEAGAIGTNRAEAAALAMHASNPHGIPADVLDEFRRLLRALSG